MADSREPSCLRCKQLEAALRAKTAQARRLVDDLEEAEVSARVYRRALLRVLTREDDDSDA